MSQVAKFDKLDFLQKLNELYDIAYEQSEGGQRRSIEWFQIACSIQETAKYIKSLIEVERKNDK